MNKLFFSLLLLYTVNVVAQTSPWPPFENTMYPSTRWWWMGSAVDKANLTDNITEYAAKGIRGLEITPIYGVQGNEKNELPFLSPSWMNAYKATVNISKKNGVRIDMNTGTGWPFGGPQVTVEDAATKVFFKEIKLGVKLKLDTLITLDDEKQQYAAKLVRLMAFNEQGEVLALSDKLQGNHLVCTFPNKNWRLIAVFECKTFQKVKRAAPGGEGLVMDHFSKVAVRNYLSRFTKAFSDHAAPYPNTFFNDSYEVYGADWTPGFFDEFVKRRGYKLEEHLPEFLAAGQTLTSARIVSDYRQTLGEMLLYNFTEQWTEWANNHGSITRNQAHGSPANLVDIYAAVDIPECEIFGISDFHIKGLRKDSLIKPNDSDLSMLKYASSAANITGKRLVSSETFTWLTEHFRTSFAQCKPDLDQLFLAGINHVFFHGTTYSPKEAIWPGWKFYASVDMSPTNPLWKDATPFFDYITRCQSFLQMGRSDNDILLYFPIWDIWQNNQGRLLMFDIHKMKQRAPAFISAVNEILGQGLNMDYISDKYLLTSRAVKGDIATAAGARYKAIVVPGVDVIPVESLKHLLALSKQGVKVIFLNKIPSNVPGYNKNEERKQTLFSLLSGAGLAGYINDSSAHYLIQNGNIQKEKTINQIFRGIQKEKIGENGSLSYVRRAIANGHIYFVTNLTANDYEGWVDINKSESHALLLDPMTAAFGRARSKIDSMHHVFLQLKSGQSIIIKTNKVLEPAIPVWKYWTETSGEITLKQGWSMKFLQSEPEISKTFALDTLSSWTDLSEPNLKNNMGTALYVHSFTLSTKQAAQTWMLKLGDVRETARVSINGKSVATLWAVPYNLNLAGLLKPGKNTLEIAVTNLPANRIADYDRKGISWRRFKEINLVKIDYSKGDYSKWSPMPSGLLGPVTLVPLIESK